MIHLSMSASIRTFVRFAKLSLLISTLSSFPCAVGQTRDSTGLFDPAAAKLMVVPGSIRQTNGKYPASLQLILVKKDCPVDHTKDFGANSSKSTYTVTVAAPGLSVVGSPSAVGCQLTLNLAIDPTVVVPGYVLASVVEHPTNAQNATLADVDHGNAVLAFLDSAAGPIPGYPQVDVIWGVLSKHLCADNFGGHVAKDLYCIEVKIGNNTGYPLQLAGLGFKPKSGITIGHSTTLALDPTPNVSYQSVRASAQAFAFLSSHNLLVNTPTAIGVLMTSFNPFFRNTFNIARWAAGTAVVGTALPGAVNIISPDMTIKQLNNLDDQSFRDGKLIPNNTQIRTMVFLERSAFEGLANQTYKAACDSLYTDAKDQKKCEKHSDDPTAVKLALGNLIIVGDEISFIQRLVVDPTVTSQEVNPAPTVTATATTTAVTANITSQTNETPLAAVITSQADSSSQIVQLDSKSKLPTATFTIPSAQALKSGSSYNIQLLFPKSAPVTVTGVKVP